MFLLSENAPSKEWYPADNLIYDRRECEDCNSQNDIDADGSQLGVVLQEGTYGGNYEIMNNIETIAGACHICCKLAGTVE